MKIFCIIWLLLLISTNIIAQGWYGGRIIVGKDTLNLMSQPLVSVMTARKMTMAELWGADLATKLGCFDDGCYMSCNAIWRIEKNKLYLEEITPCCGDFNSTTGHRPKVDLKKIFPDLFQDSHVFAKWDSEELLAGCGEALYSDLEGLRLYAKERGFIIEKGVLQKIIEYDNSKTKLSPYKEHELLLRDILYSNIRWDEIKSEVDSTRKFVWCNIVSTNESGKIDSVAIAKGQSELLNREAIRVVKSIPQWEVLFKKGKQIHRSWTLGVKFDTQTMNKYSH